MRPPPGCAPRWTPTGSPTRSTREPAPSTAPRSTSTCATPSAGRGSCQPSSSTSTLPERFGLEYVAADGSRPRPVMIHRALFGAVERFFGLLVEHYAGAFPAWLAPVQAQVLPVAAAHADYAEEVAGTLASKGFRVETSPAEGASGQACPQRQGGQGPLRAGGGRRRRRRRHGRRQRPAARRSPSATCRWKPSRPAWQPRSRPGADMVERRMRPRRIVPARMPGES